MRRMAARNFVSGWMFSFKALRTVARGRKVAMMEAGMVMSSSAAKVSMFT